MTDQDIGCGVESIQVTVNADQEEGYEGMVLKAMVRVQEFMPDASVHRMWDEAREHASPSKQAWFMSCGHSEVSPGGTGLQGTFTFILYQPDRD